MSDCYNNASPMAADIKNKAKRIAELEAEVERLKELLWHPVVAGASWTDEFERRYREALGDE